MSLLQLPPEILLQVLCLVGSDFFAASVDRLSVSKQWFDIAYPVFLGDVTLTSKALDRLFSQPIKQSTLDSLQRHAGAVQMKLRGFDQWQEVSANSEVSVRDISKWTARLEENLGRLSTLLTGSTRLKVLAVQAMPELHNTGLSTSRRSYLSLGSVDKLLLADNVTSLDIDFGGTALSSRRGSHLHLCEAINVRLPSLRRLRCRLCQICPEILSIDPDAHYDNLEEVIINLSLSEMTPVEAAYRYPARCNSQRNFTHLLAALEERAALLAERMRTVKMVRLISHSLPSMQICAFDALTGRRMRLKSLQEWDADGEDILDELPSSEDEALPHEFDSSESETDED